MSDQRNPWDGKPYYCVMCGLGFGEYMACTGIDCQLESVGAATSRKETREELSQVLSDALAEAGVQ